jgi:hypothetical protein
LALDGRDWSKAAGFRPSKYFPVFASKQTQGVCDYIGGHRDLPETRVLSDVMAKPPATQNRDADDQIVVCVGW